jgi:hypothetical protein
VGARINTSALPLRHSHSHSHSHSHRALPLRHVPIGYSAALALDGVDHGAAANPRLAFLGHAHYRPARCWAALNGSDGWLSRRFATVHAWHAHELRPLLSRRASWFCKIPSTVLVCTALDQLKAQAAPTHPGAPPEQLERLPWASAARLGPLQS